MLTNLKIFFHHEIGLMISFHPIFLQKIGQKELRRKAPFKQKKIVQFELFATGKFYLFFNKPC